MRSTRRREYRSRNEAHAHYRCTERLAVRVVPLYEAEIVEEVGTRTIDVFTVKVALVAPAGTNTLEGTLAAPLLLESLTAAPPPEPRPLSSTVPVAHSLPPPPLVRFTATD